MVQKKRGPWSPAPLQKKIDSGDTVAQNQMLRQDSCRVVLNGLCFLACFQDHASHFISPSIFPLENLALSKV